MTFQQPPPALGNQYEDDRVLRSYLRRTLTPETLLVIEPSLVEMGRLAGSDLYRMQLLEHAESWLTQARKEGQAALEAGARSFAMTLGRTMELALLIRHAQWSREQQADERAAARRFAGCGIDLLVARDPDDARVLFKGS